MALLTDDGKYIKISKNGDYTIYKCEEDRIKEKNATSSTEILFTFKNKLQELEEKAYYTRGNEQIQAKQEYEEWLAEYLKYQEELLNKTKTGEYKHIKKIFPNILDSLPEVSEGSICIDELDVDRCYNYVKETNLLGNTQDV